MRLLLSIVIAALMLPSLPANAEQQLQGAWTISRASEPGKVQLDLRLDDSGGAYHDESSDTVALSDLHLTQAQLDSSGSRVSFPLTRDAGSFAFDGWLQQGGGGGHFTFTPDARYAGELARRGYTVDQPRKMMTAALLNLSLPYIDQMNNAGFGHLPYDKLIAFCALKIDTAYIQDMRSHFSDVDADNIVSLRALKVDDAYLADLKSMGMPATAAHEAVELKALKIDSAYVKEMASVGYPHLSARELVEMKALGINADFVHRLEAHGFHNLSPEKLVQAKALGVI